MFKDLQIHATFNERTGYGVHASRFFPLLQKLVAEHENASGSVAITLLDVVSASQVTSFPKSPSILFNVWESTKYPANFLKNLEHYDQLWVPSEWQRACSIAQGVPEECVKVVPEGVDVETYKPFEPFIEGQKSSMDFETFRFVTVGQWQPRKSTQEIIESFLKAFPIADYPDVRLELSVDTLFPSDNYKSTEERLEAYGLQDPRIIVIHFEEREDYVRRLQNSHCFVSCARSEGWGLPIIEAMACGIPTIVADWSGSTEYATDAIKVRIKELIKPFGIYGNWEVPGEWCQPDYDHLVEQMKDVYNNWVKHKEAAMKSSERIRRDFSWEAAARKAVVHLEEFHQKWLSEQNKLPAEIQSSDIPVEDEVRSFAASRGFEIVDMRKRSAIFEVECWPSSPEKIETLIETITQIKSLGYPVLLSSHYPEIPHDVIAMVDYYIHEKRDIMSGEDKPVYWRKRINGTTETKQANVEYQGVAALNCFRNSIDFCRGRYDWIYQMNADMEVDLQEWLNLVIKSQKSMVCIPYEGRKDGIGGGLWAGRTEVLDKYVPHLNSWKEYADKFPDFRFVVERWLYAYLLSQGCDFDKEVDWITIHTHNRFDNVDREIWEDDDFLIHFADGPFFQIQGISNREYDVNFIDNQNNVNMYGIKQKVGHWSRASHKYYKDWTVTASLNGEEKFRHRLDLNNKNVYISFGSKALGDTISWMPYVEEFRKKHNIKNLYCSGWWQEIFDYPNIQFVKPGTVLNDLYATYSIGCFDNQPELNPVNWREVNLQKVATDILGLDYQPIRAKLKIPPYPVSGKKYVCFSEFSTMRGKLWNRPGAWQNIIDYLNSLGYECISIANERTALKNVKIHSGQPIQKTIADIAGCEFYIGLNHGPAWIALALDKPTIMITGMSEPFNDFPNPYRISVDDCRPGCFNDPSIPIMRDWEWCPRGKDYACTRNITEEMVINVIDKIREDLQCQSLSAKTKVEDTESVRPVARTQKTRRSKKQKHKNACLTQ